MTEYENKQDAKNSNWSNQMIYILPVIIVSKLCRIKSGNHTQGDRKSIENSIKFCPVAPGTNDEHNGKNNLYQPKHFHPAKEKVSCN